MAEARSAAALSFAGRSFEKKKASKSDFSQFSVTHDGVSVSYDQELLRDIWHGISRSYKRRTGRFRNDFMNGMFPANSWTLGLVVGAVAVFSVIKHDLSFGIFPFIQNYIVHYIFG